MIYAYSTPEIPSHNGWLKIGYTERDVDTRIREQSHTLWVNPKKEWTGKAVYKDGRTFTDKDFHRYLKLNGIQYVENDRNEWFKISPFDSLKYFENFVANGFFMLDITHEDISSYRLREEQLEAVSKTIEYSKAHKGGNFLWNAKPRFGKTLCVYDLMTKTSAENILIVTNRPVIANSWKQDYEKFIGSSNGYYFVSSVKDLKNAMSYQDYLKNLSRNKKLIYFVSLQDLKGSKYFGGTYDKLKEISEILWDILVIDEAHEGVETSKTDTAFGHIKRNFTLYLSGTPFKALASNKFSDEAIFNWTYADEQNKRENWNSDEDNPYETLPTLNLFTYRMSEIFQNEKNSGKFNFDLNEFFAVKNEKFVYDSEIDKFLNALTSNKKFPFSTPELRNELKHTFWLLNRVESAKLLAAKLKKHPVFENYKIILAAGNGKLNDDDDNAVKKSYNSVVKAISENDKTITLSVSQLTTGVTIPEWTGVLILSNIQSASMYMQAAFRAQNSCLFCEDKKFLRKKNAYVFDFDPARSLVVYEQFANDLIKSQGSSENNIKKFLNFFPVVGEDDNGEMIRLEAAKILSIPRRLKSLNIVQSGFMSDFLFSPNIYDISKISEQAMKIISKFAPSENLNIKDRLLPFTRTIPAFLMAYGNEETRLENFDSIIPEKIFLDVTGITLEEFRFLRDDEKIFASVEFNDAVKKFMELREEFSNYFEKENTDDIFDYIPPQKANQIFTSKNIVNNMLDMLEKENPGCFDDPEKTFIDPYMKSGNFIAGIVTRLYRSKNLKKIFPDKIERLKHIFEKQIFALAPNEIMYKISMNFLLGFDKKSEIKKINIRQFDFMTLNDNDEKNFKLKFNALFEK